MKFKTCLLAMHRYPYDSYTVNSVTFTDMVSTSYSSNNGDSGGVVYSAPDASNYAYAVGVHKGSSGTLKTYVKAGNALNALGAGMY